MWIEFAILEMCTEELLIHNNISEKDYFGMKMNQEKFPDILGRYSIQQLWAEPFNIPELNHIQKVGSEIFIW